MGECDTARPKQTCSDPGVRARSHRCNLQNTNMSTVTTTRATPMTMR